MDLKQILVERISSISNVEINIVSNAMEIPPNPKMGDLAFPCFSLAKVMRKAPPLIATEIADDLGQIDGIAEVQVVGGYLNFFFDRTSIAKTTIGDVLSKGDDYGKANDGDGAKVVLDFSSPNIAKPFHIGHLFSTALGHSLSRIYEFLGYESVRINHLGDWGTQFGKLISAYHRWGDKATIDNDPINELLKIYVKFHEEAEKDTSLDDEAREYFKKLEEGDAETTKLWKYFREISLVEFDRVYDRLGIKFDSYAGESFYNDKMDAVVKELKEKGLLTDSEGAKVVDLSAEDIPPCIIIKSNGTTIYATRDITAALYRHKTYDFCKALYVVGTPQSLHFKQIFTVLKKMGYTWADNCEHVDFGLVKFPDKKLSTRNGDVVFLEDVLKEAVSKTRDILESNSPDIEDKDDVAEKLGIGAILYTFLKNNRTKDIVFSWDTMLDFEGESAPYVQYAYARAKSVLRNAKTSYDDADLTLLTTDDEYDLVKQLGAYTDNVRSAADKNEPFYINRYVTNVAKAFNKFYNTSPILKSDVDDNVRKARLALCEASSIVIKSALYLLGISTVEKM